jgi:SMP-30/gluconolaconase/LRE-like protein
MKVRAFTVAFSISLGTALLTSCGDPHLPAATYALQPQSSTSRPANADLIYVAVTYPRSVAIYTWRGKLVKTIQLSYSPSGLCTDANGNVYVADTAGAKIVEYAPDGSRLGVLKEPGQRPLSCSVDPKTSDLAVTNGKTSSRGNGSVAIYAGAEGEPTLYSNPSLTTAFYCGYDEKGNLFVDGFKGPGFPGSTWLGELLAGEHSLTQIRLNRRIKEPGTVQWENPYVTIGASIFDTMYRIKVSGSKGEVEGTTKLKKAEVIDSWVQGTKVVGTTIIFSSVPGKIMVWDYPAGGKPIKEFGLSQFTAGVTVGLASSH